MLVSRNGGKGRGLWVEKVLLRFGIGVKGSTAGTHILDFLDESQEYAFLRYMEMIRQ